jgi:hypothetical protein
MKYSTIQCEEIWNAAHEAGMIAGKECMPIPMVVQEHVNMLDDKSPIKQQWTISDGPCGFASVYVKGNNSFVKWCKLNKKASKGYYGGTLVKWVCEFNQSMTRKEAYAHAFADVLNKAGLEAWAESRMD